MKNKHYHSAISAKSHKEDDINRSSEGITEKLLKKYKPSDGLFTLGRARNKKTQRGLA